MYNDKNLSKEFKETMEETKEMLMATAMKSSVSSMDADELMDNVKALRLLNRLCDLCCAMFEKQDKLMDKMDKAMDKYLTVDDKKK
jgi:hypothetical protein